MTLIPVRLDLMGENDLNRNMKKEDNSSRLPVEANLNLQARVEELEETLRAIKGGDVDAIVVSGQHGEQVYTLNDAGQPYRVLIETMNEGTVTVGADGTVLYCNGRLAEMLGVPPNGLIGTSIRNYIAEEDLTIFDGIFKEGLNEKCQGEVVMKAPDRTMPAQLSLSPVHSKGLNCVIIVITDLTKQKKSEEALRRASEDLESQIKERTAQLQDREKDLEIKTHSLEEANIALKVLLRRRDEDKLEIEKKILLNIKELAVPYLEKLKLSGLDEKQKTYLSILESNLNQILSSFPHRLTSEFLNLTSTEIRVADLLRQDKTTKEISELLNSTPRTIAFHRNSIRQKLGIRNKKANLKAYLLSLE